MISEKIQLLGKGLYKTIPDELTITSIPTASELDYVGAEDFEATMLDKILPSCVEEKDINFRELLEIDFHWICRCLRILNYGPYHTTNSIFCNKCGRSNPGEYQVDLTTIACKPLPENFKNEVKVSKDEFIEFKCDITLKLPTIQAVMNMNKDKAFVDAVSGKTNRELARLCYCIASVGDDVVTPVEAKMIIQKEMTSADYLILKGLVASTIDYGLRAGGTTVCPRCGSTQGAFIALVDDRFFRPTLGDLRQWKHSIHSRKA